MDTPICDFVRKYSESNTVRMHMPGHKGKDMLGFESIDITEIKGADSLYEAYGIIAKSESNASRLFGCDTFYSAEGSSLCIRAMLYLTLLYAKGMNRSPLIFAGRNAHKVFITSAALLDMDVKWLVGDKNDSYLSFSVTPRLFEEQLSSADTLPAALYVTSPDYLGNTVDIRGLSEVCKKYNVLLLVDNAHGAYLRFLPEAKHPMDMGADMCCDSAHKTLPVVTGGAYLHINKKAPSLFSENAKKAMALFGSTSPSYIILQSLDRVNPYLESEYRDILAKTTEKISVLKKTLTEKGYRLLGDEPLKITVAPKGYGYTGYELADILRGAHIECEFSDPDHVVLMLTPNTSDKDIEVLRSALLSVPQKAAIDIAPPAVTLPKKAVSVRSATLSAQENIPAKNSLGRVLAYAEVGCPPAVPIVVSGEIIDENAIACFEYYGIDTCCVVIE